MLKGKAALDAARKLVRTEAFIEGRFVKPLGGRILTIANPANSSDTLVSGRCGMTEVGVAVASARSAFEGWSTTDPAARAAILDRTASLIEEKTPQLAALESLNTGKPLREAEGDMSECVSAFRHSAGFARDLLVASPERHLPDVGLNGTLVKEPLGVVAGVCPWNYPAMMAAWKIAPALAAGCSIVVKPSELSPFTTLALASVLQEAGLPDGCVSVLPGAGDVGAALSEHPDVDKVSFTGSVPTGTAVMRSAAGGAKAVTLELGGKSPAIVTSSADLDRTVEWLLFGAFWNCGQICSATSRILVARELQAELTERLVTEARALTVGGPFGDSCHDMGPLISGAQLDKVRGFLRAAVAEGSTIACGGSTPKGLEHGFFMAPTVVTGVKPGDTLWSEEVFGPVVSITPFATTDEAVELANDSRFGLAAAVFSEDDAEMRAISKRIRAGTVWENCNQPVSPSMPWGGYKMSGLGREMGSGALDPFMEAKVLMHQPKATAEPLGWFSRFR